MSSSRACLTDKTGNSIDKETIPITNDHIDTSITEHAMSLNETATTIKDNIMSIGTITKTMKTYMQAQFDQKM